MPKPTDTPSPTSTMNPRRWPGLSSSLRAALDAVLTGKEVNLRQKPSMGCNIKWKSGNEPDYFKLG